MESTLTTVLGEIWGDGNKTVVNYPMIIIPLSIVWWEAKNISGKHSCIIPISSKSFLHLLLTTFYWNIFRYKWQKIHILESNQEFAKFVDFKKAVFLRWSGMRVPVKRVVWSEGENVFLRPPSKSWGSGISKHVSGQMMTHMHALPTCEAISRPGLHALQGRFWEKTDCFAVCQNRDTFSNT